MEDSAPWGSFEQEDTAQFVQPSSIPLRFHKLFAESRPVNGQVDRSQLEKLLKQASLDSTDILTILNSISTDNVVDEADFYKALFSASALQNPEQEPEDIILKGDDHEDPAHEPDNELAANGPYDPAGPRPIRVEIKPGKEGRWGFKHTVYIVTGTVSDQSVLVYRRYSDFVWLLDYLVQHYTFRCLPLLPPKRVQINGHFLSGDTSQFLYRRRLGLARFLNLLVVHPVIGKDSAVTAFLTSTSPIDLVKPDFDRRKKAGLDTPSSDELTDLLAKPSFIVDFDEKKYTDWLNTMQTSVEKALVGVTTICKLFAHQSRRLYIQAGDACSMTIDFQNLQAQLDTLYPDERDNIEVIAKGVGAMAKHQEQDHGAFLDAAAAIQDSALEDIKYYRDILLSVRELYRRHRTFGGNTVLQLKSRIDRTKLKIDSIRASNQPDQIVKLEGKIKQYQESIKHQVNRSWLIKQVMTQELVMVQSSQYQLSRVIRNFAGYKLAMNESFKAISSSLYDQVSDLPLK